MPDIDWYNPPFDDRIGALPSVSGIAIKRGYMVTSQTSIAKDVAGFANKGIRFLYNPSDLSLSYQTDQTRFPGDLAPGESLYISTNIGSARFSLLFDRTYELWMRNGYGTPYNTDNMQSPIDTPELGAMIGVLADINAFRYLTGILPSEALGLNTSKDIGPPMPVPFYFNFGEPEDTGLANLALGVHGYIAGLDIRVTHWTSDLVPMRAVVSLSVNMTTKDSTNDPLESSLSNPTGDLDDLQDALDPTAPPNPGDGAADPDSIPGATPPNRRGGR